MVRALVILCAVAGVARAEGLLVGASAGGHLPLSRLDPTVTVGVELGWGRGAFAATVAVDAAQPAETGRAGGADYTLRVRELRVAALAHARLELGPVVGYVAAGPALLVVATRESGRQGDVRFAASERESRPAGVGAVGLERRLGGGFLVGSVVVGVARFGGVLTGDASAAAVEVRLGYRVWL